jgi:hypothetical protein
MREAEGARPTEVIHACARFVHRFFTKKASRTGSPVDELNENLSDNSNWDE